MFLFNSLRAQHHLINESRTLPGDAGLTFSFSHFKDGSYSPVLGGLIRTAVVEPSNSEKSGQIVVTIDVRSSNPDYKDNIRIDQQENHISISTGGLSLFSYATAPRLVVEVTISLPSSIGNFEINTLSLPVKIESIGRANDVVIHTQSSSISVAKIIAHSLAVSSQSGSITFEPFSKQEVETFTKISNSSGSTNLHSSISSPELSTATSSGGLKLGLATTATKIQIGNSSGSIAGEVEYVIGQKKDSVSEYLNHSGGLNVRLKGWSGFLTAENGSGSKHVGGSGLERWNDGWRKGDGGSTASFRNGSGSLKVEVL